MAVIEQLLVRREQVTAAIVKTVDALGDLVAEEIVLQDALRRAAEADGARSNVFSTVSTTNDAVCSELTRRGLRLHRADPRYRLAALVQDQHGRYRKQAVVRQQVAGQSAA
jgi:hypothetical protein